MGAPPAHLHAAHLYAPLLTCLLPWQCPQSLPTKKVFTPRSGGGGLVKQSTQPLTLQMGRLWPRREVWLLIPGDSLTARQARQEALRHSIAFLNLSLCIHDTGVIRPILRFFCVWVQHVGSTRGISGGSYPHPPPPTSAPCATACPRARRLPACCSATPGEGGLFMLGEHLQNKS